MPILQAVPPDAPLQQGDVLDRITTLVGRGLEPPDAQTGMVLVVSRNCVALRSGEVVVARVAKRPLKVPAQATFDALVSTLTAVRDGDGRPSTFYLGEINESGSRFEAKFDSLHSISVPIDSEQRAQFLQVHRKSTLAPEFAHDLHQRLFRCFSSMGFDDSGWWSAADLKLVVDQGEAEVLALRAQLHTAQSSKNIAEAGGAVARTLRPLDDTLKSAGKQLHELEAKLEPLQAELKRRKLA